MTNLQPAQLREELDNGLNILLLDVREQWEFELCHIEGSVNISLSRLANRITELDKEQKTIVICHHGMRSAMAAEFLQAEGFTQIANLEGGVDAWASTVDQSMPKY